MYEFHTRTGPWSGNQFAGQFCNPTESQSFPLSNWFPKFGNHFASQKDLGRRSGPLNSGTSSTHETAIFQAKSRFARTGSQLVPNWPTGTGLEVAHELVPGGALKGPPPGKHPVSMGAPHSWAGPVRRRAQHVGSRRTIGVTCSQGNDPGRKRQIDTRTVDPMPTVLALPRRWECSVCGAVHPVTCTGDVRDGWTWLAEHRACAKRTGAR